MEATPEMSYFLSVNIFYALNKTIYLNNFFPFLPTYKVSATLSIVNDLEIDGVDSLK